MAIFGAILVLLGAYGYSKVPSDQQISQKVQTSIQQQLHPSSVQVSIHRRSRLSTTVRSADITISGFSADNLPIGAPSARTTAKPASVPAPTVTATPATPTTPAIPATPATPNRGPMTTAVPLQTATPAVIAVPAQPRSSGRAIRVVDLHLRCDNFTAGGLPIQEMDWRVHEARIPWAGIKTGNVSIAAAHIVTGYVVVKQDALTKFARARSLPIDKPEITITSSGCKVCGTLHTLIAMPVEIDGRLVAKDGAKIYLSDPKVKIAGMTLPRDVTDRMLKSVNPLVDLNADLKLPAPLAITNTTCGDGLLRFDALLQFPQPE